VAPLAPPPELEGGHLTVASPPADAFAHRAELPGLAAADRRPGGV